MSQEKNPLISVIVPIYKVEDYLDECVESILAQTHKNLEIILVDDGSPDSCPQKCDDWAKKDSRIKVVHKKNGGLSSARNAGMDVATGDYIGFVDSDDLIAPDMFEYLLSGFSHAENIAVTSGMVMAFDNEGNRFPYKKDWTIENERIISHDDLFVLSLNETICFPVWTKLYRADVIQEIRFPEGRNNEDSYFIFELSKVLEREKLDLLDMPKYVYFYRYMRPGSICNTTKKPLLIDVLANMNDYHQYYKSINNDKKCDTVKKRYRQKLHHFCMVMFDNPHWEKDYFTEYHKKLKSESTKDMLDALSRSKKMQAHYLMLRYMAPLYIPLKKFKRRNSK